MSKKQRAHGVQVVVRVDVVPTSSGTADVKTRLEVDGEEWMVEAIAAAQVDGRLSAAFDALAQAIVAPIGDAVLRTMPLPIGRVGRA